MILTINRMDFQTELKEQILDETAFIEATFKGAKKGHSVPWQRVVIRPISLKNGRFLQISYFDDQKHVAKNYSGPLLAERLDELLTLPFKTMQVKGVNGRLLVQMSKKGKPIIHRERASEPLTLPLLSHDHQKEQLLSPDQPVPFLQAVGIMTKGGRVKASRRRKFRQINKFLQLVDETVDISGVAEPLRVVDFGCGNAYLTLAIYHYLHEIKQLDTHMIGVDIKSDLMQRHNQTAHDLGWPQLQFKTMSIQTYQPQQPPHVVLALHACDTATDEALAQGIKSGAQYIFTAPCCHHHLQAQLNQQSSPNLFDPVLRHGILKERWGDILTDSFRALILRIMGYRTDVIEFVSTEHTPRNVMIRALKTTKPGDKRFVDEYVALKSFWQVTPYLETLLGAQFDERNES